MTDLLARCALSDQRAFKQLYERTGAQLFGILLRILNRRDWAEDALQDTYLRVWNRASTYRPDKGSPWVWLVSIARYRALDMLRGQRRNPVEERDGTHQVDNEAAPKSSVIGLQTRALQRCLDTLQPNQRRSLLLSYCDGYTHDELSAKLRAPLGTVKSWVRRGLLALRECLEA